MYIQKRLQWKNILFLLEKYKAIYTKIEDLKNIELNTLPVYDDRYIKTKIKTYDDKVFTNFRDLNVSEDDSLLVYKNKYYFDNLDDNTFED